MVPASAVIELSELRIGNILEYDGKYVHVTNISLDVDDEYNDTIGFCELGKNTDEDGGWNRELADKLKRIAITRELLVKCSFNYESDGELWSDNETLFYKKDDCDIIFDDFLGCKLHGEELDNIKYLHQLQNLYFLLMQEEIKINL